MERALRVVSVERGYDPRQFALVAFGGAGGLHACDLAAALGIPRVIIPAMPGALSAFGILTSDIVKDYSRTVMLKLDAKSPLASLSKHYETLERTAQREFHDEGWQGKLRLERTADLRYKGQGYELNVPFSRSVLEDFHGQHQFRYGYSHAERAVELVTLRLRARIASPKIPLRKSSPAQPSTAPEKRRAWFSGKASILAIYDREQLKVGIKIRGPAMIAEYSATTIVPAGFSAHTDRAGNLLLELGKRKGAG
jgi:N-methylhydantoinase A